MSNSAQILVERKRRPMIDKIKLREAVKNLQGYADTLKNLGHKTPEHIQTAIDLINSALNDELVKAKPSMSQKELIKIIEEIYGHCKHPDGEQCSEKLADLILSAGSQEKREVDIEIICEKVHQAYCKYHLENKGTEYCLHN